MTQDYTLETSKAAKRQLHRLPDRVAIAVVEFVTAVLPGNPLRLSMHLAGDLDGLRTARRGDYRILLRVDEQARTVIVVKVAHRADVYRDIPKRT